MQVQNKTLRSQWEALFLTEAFEKLWAPDCTCRTQPQAVCQVQQRFTRASASITIHTGFLIEVIDIWWFGCVEKLVR